jgi:Bacteriophage protein of unknown function (DUF646).
MAEGFRLSRTTKSAEKLINSLQKKKNANYMAALKSNGNKAVSIYQRMTPVDTGRTANSYSYDVKKVGSGLQLVVTNSNVTRDGVPIPILIHYGHGTGTGGYVPARPFLDRAGKQVKGLVKPDVERMLRNG